MSFPLFRDRRKARGAWKQTRLLALAALASVWLSCATHPPPLAVLSADLDGDNSAETVEAFVRGQRVALRVRDPRGKLLGQKDAPTPLAGTPSVTLAKGELGSAGALWEVTASAGGEACRSVWRLRSGQPEPLPILTLGTAIPPCAPAGEWTTRFERNAEDAPAAYVRERSRTTPRGLHRETQRFAFSGFRMDLVSSTDEIDGVVIPNWFDAVLYSRPALKALSERFDLAPLRSLPRLQIDTDGPSGIFRLRLTDGGESLEASVRAVTPGEEKNRVKLEARVEAAAEKSAKTAQVKVELAGNSQIPIEAEVLGLGTRFDTFYAPVTGFQEGALRVFPNAEAELVSENLTGVWTNEKGEMFPLDPLAGSHTGIRFRREEFSVRLDGAPAGADLLLVPGNGTAPFCALDLQGPNAFSRLPIQCPGWPDLQACQGAGSGEVLRRVGARVNLR